MIAPTWRRRQLGSYARSLTVRRLSFPGFFGDYARPPRLAMNLAATRPQDEIFRFWGEWVGSPRHKLLGHSPEHQCTSAVLVVVLVAVVVVMGAAECL